MFQSKSIYDGGVDDGRDDRRVRMCKKERVLVLDQQDEKEYVCPVLARTLTRPVLLQRTGKVTLVYSIFISSITLVPCDMP